MKRKKSAQKKPAREPRERAYPSPREVEFSWIGERMGEKRFVSVDREYRKERVMPKNSLCETVEKLFPKYLEKTLSKIDAERVDRYLAGCRQCYDAYTRFRKEQKEQMAKANTAWRHIK